MKQLSSMIWKEWHEARAYLWIGLGIFIGLPLIAECEAIYHTTRRFQFDGSTAVLAFGGLLAVIVSVGITCRDLHGHIEDFWRSRPVSVVRWWLVKFAVGLGIVLLVCMLPIALELCFTSNREPIRLLIWFPFLWSAIYSIGFLSGCVIRRTAHAATLAFAGLLLVYLIPIIIPPLQWLSVTQIPEEDWSYTNGRVRIFGHRDALFALGMFGVALTALVLAIQSMRRGWHIESGRKTMYGLISTALILLLASAAFQLGTDLPILQKIDLPATEYIDWLRCDAAGGYVLTSALALPPGPFIKEHHRRSIEVTSAGIRLGKPVEMNESQWENLAYHWGSHLQLSPDVICDVEAFYPNPHGPPMIMRVHLFDAHDGATLKDLNLWTSEDFEFEPWVYSAIWQSRLYIVGRRLMVVDVTDVTNPRVISDVKGEIPPTIRQDDRRAVVFLPAVPGLPPEQRLRTVLRNWTFDGTTWLGGHGNGFAAYRLARLTDDRAIFDRVGKVETTLLQKLFADVNYAYGSDSLRNGLFYSQGNQGQRFFNSSISVFDTRGPRPMRQVGHFAAPGAWLPCPLDDGRAIVGGGHTLWLVGPPPRHSAD